MAGVVFATSAGTARNRAATDDTTDATYLQAAIEARRADIGAVPGSGEIRGVWVLNATVYAVRDNAGGTAGVIHKSTTAGWEEVVLDSVIEFDTGTAEFVEGETLTGGSSGATATIHRVVTTTDADWGGGTATGYLVIYSVTGNFTSGETITSASGSATSTSVDSLQTLSPGGKYDTDNYNFYGATGTQFTYGCNGLDYGFEFTGTRFAFIRTNTAPDTPKHVKVHKNHLMWGIKSSLIFSAPGLPFDYTTAAGAGEVALGTDINGILDAPGGVLNIFSRDADSFLFGNDSSDFALRQHSDTRGGIEWTGKTLGSMPLMFDEMGIVTKQATDQFGDFSAIVMSDRIQPLLALKYSSVTTASVSTTKGLYRLFFDDKSGMTMGVSQAGALTGFFPLNYAHKVCVVGRGEDANGEEAIFFGSDNGFVYQMDKGTSHDGASIISTARFAFNHLGTPQNKKRFFLCVLEMKSPSNITLNVTPDFTYADPDLSTASTETLNVESGGGFWDFSTWESFNWSQAVVATGKVHIDGSGYNLSLLLYEDATYTQPHTIEGYTLHYSVRGLNR